MKIKLFFSIFIAALLLNGCANDNGKNGGSGTDRNQEETQKVFLRFDIDGTRAVEAPAAGTTAQFLSGLIYFLDDSADPVVYAVRIVGGGAGSDASIAQITAGVEFTGIPSSASQVYIVGNYNSSDGTTSNNTASFPTNAGTTLSTIQETVLNIQEVAYPELVDGTTATGLLTVMDGIAPIVPYAGNEAGWTGAGTPTAEDFYSNVNISPINARIEIAELSYTGELTSFEVEGIYLNNYYTHMPLSLQDNGARVSVTNNGSNVYLYDRTDPSFAYTNYSVLYDVVEEAVTPVAGAATITPPTGVWAYHVFGNHDPVPHIVVKFTNVVDQNDVNVGDRYITVVGYTQNTTSTELTSLSRRTVYRIASIAFDDNDLQILPETDTVNIWVRVTVLPWVPVDVTPIL